MHHFERWPFAPDRRAPAAAGALRGRCHSSATLDLTFLYAGRLRVACTFRALLHTSVINMTRTACSLHTLQGKERPYKVWGHRGLTGGKAARLAFLLHAAAPDSTWPSGRSVAPNIRAVLLCISGVCAAAAACAPLFRLQGAHGDAAAGVPSRLQGAPDAGGGGVFLCARGDSGAAAGALCGRSADPKAAGVHGAHVRDGVAGSAAGAAAAGSHVTRMLRGRPAGGHAAGGPMPGCHFGKLHAGVLVYECLWERNDAILFCDSRLDQPQRLEVWGT